MRLVDFDDVLRIIKYYGVGGTYCSECEEEGLYYKKYCSNCGARMDGGAENECNQ